MQYLELLSSYGIKTLETSLCIGAELRRTCVVLFSVPHFPRSRQRAAGANAVALTATNCGSERRALSETRAGLFQSLLFRFDGRRDRSRPARLPDRIEESDTWHKLYVQTYLDNRVLLASDFFRFRHTFVGTLADRWQLASLTRAPVVKISAITSNIKFVLCVQADTSYCRNGMCDNVEGKFVAVHFNILQRLHLIDIEDEEFALSFGTIT